MKRKTSLGTIFTVALTLVVTVGCVHLISRFGGDFRGVLQADQLLSVFKTARNTAAPMPTAAPSAASAIKTTTVTIAPTQERQQPTAMPSQTAHTVTMTFSGAIDFEKNISDSVRSGETFDYGSVFQYIQRYVYADVNLAPLNNLLTAQGNAYTDTVVPAAAADGLKALGLSGVLLNHADVLDQGTQGLEETVGALRQRGLDSYGAERTENIPLLQINGVTIAVLGYLDTPGSRTEKAMADASSPVARLDTEQVKKDIAAVHSRGAQVVVVSLTWLSQSDEQLTDTQREQARQIAAAGADIILGGGSSAALPVEMIQTLTSDGQSRQTLCAYAMGTLISARRDKRSEVSGLLLHVRLTVDGQSRVSFDTVTYTPTYVWRQSVDGKTQYRVLCSAEAPPEAMSSQQKEIMGRALVLIQNLMADSPAVRRE